MVCICTAALISLMLVACTHGERVPRFVLDLDCTSKVNVFQVGFACSRSAKAFGFWGEKT